MQYLRNGNNASKIVMDSLSYKYNAATNQLNHVRDNVPDNDYPSTGYIDIDNQSADNYTYDEIGNLIKDDAEGVTSIEWNVYGKITKQSFSTTTVGETKNVYYYYDAAGNRMGKRNEKVAASGTTNDYLWYVRDASGNVMATYNSNPATGNTVPNTLTVKERHLFGSSRLGIFTLKKDVKATPSFTQTAPYNRSWIRGYKSYELSNHLGNVLSTITDIKFGVDTNSDEVIDYYTADVAGAQDYYPFGATQPGRSNGVSYRYGFNGKEKDKEGMTQYDYGFRIYDPRLGRFKSVYPLTQKYPALSPYQFASNSPIVGNDLDGLEFTKYLTPGILPVLGSNISQEAIKNAAEAKRTDPNAGLLKIAWKAAWTTSKDQIHTGLDVIGMIPVLGEVPDAVNGGLYLLESDYENAAFSFAATLPLFGWGATSTKWAKNILKFSDNAFHSSAGLVFKQARNESRLSHVLKHTVDNLKKSTHGIFEASEEGLVRLLDDAYSKIKSVKWNDKLTVGGSETIDGITRSIRKEKSGKISENFVMDMGKKIGYEGGSKGSGAALNKVQISVEKGTSDVLTAFPTK